ncbi:AGE family epimerase/isomerase [Pedobacter sp. ASV1-7]|uniref:AGE family epimerase/isomerase n=1 Tax=Pedobacter sp. ASV1-7 TaxID=3145237 RepID=UPI0032E86B42
MQSTLENYIQQYRSNLLEDVIPFWLKNSFDEEFGGFFTCLDRTGKVYDTDKFAWLQNRQIWCFSMLYNQVEKKQEWLDFAIQGAEFMKVHGRDKEGNWYFALTRTGTPLIQPHSIFSDCFASMAYAQLYTATGNKEYAKIAVDTFHNILKKQENSKGIYNKSYPGTRPMQGFSLPMILSNLVLELETLLDPELVERTMKNAVNSVMEVFYQPELGLILENVSDKGEFVDCFEGRVVNPGHGLEAMWFIMDLGNKMSDPQLIRKAVDISLNILEYGWDKEYQGILYFKDVKDAPPLQLEWDQKLWWVHVETMVCMLKGYMYTGDQRCWDWFEKVHAYSWSHFADSEYGEWFGYLNRRGEVLSPAKGGKWKGCFHVPRGLYQCWKVLETIKEKQSTLTV